MRTIRQPEIAPSERIQWVEAGGKPIAADLEPGLLLLDAVRRVFAAHGLASGVLRLEGGAFGPFAYVMPALSETSQHAAFYSPTLRPPGLSRIPAPARSPSGPATARPSSTVMRSGPRRTALFAAATSCPRRHSSSNRSGSAASGSTARRSRPYR